ncbi:protein FAM124A-like [Branchiostoma floridae x Branchiostoma japonicum]
MDVQDPFGCRLELYASDVGKAQMYRQALRPLLAWLDPAFQLVCISQQRPECPRLEKTEGNTQAISVVLLLREDSGDLSATSGRDCLHRPPWRFHHRIELVRTTNATCIAKQEFYDLGSKLPLWCVEPIHCGNEIFRFNLVVRNFSAMVDFYTRLTQKKAACSKPGFCLFTLYSQPGLDIQLALKRSEYLTPYPTSKAMLKFVTQSVAKMADLKPYKIGEDFMVKDPDGNPVLLEVKEQKRVTLEEEETRNWCEIGKKEGAKEEFTDDASSLLDDLQSEISVSESLDSGAYCASWEGSDSSTSGYFELSELSSLSLDDIDEDSLVGDYCRPESDIRDDESVLSAFF